MNKNISIDTLYRLVLGSDAMPDFSVNEMIMAQAAKRTERKGKTSIRIFLAAAVIAILTTGTALAATGVFGDWFIGFFRDRSGGELSPSQEQLIEDSVLTIDESVANDNLTVTLESALCDDYTAYIKLRIEAPEGVELDKDNYNFEHYSVISDEEIAQYIPHISGVSKSCGLVEDDDGRSNTVSILISQTVTGASDSGFSFRNGETRELRLENFQTWSLDEGYTTLVEGVWSFDVIFSDGDSIGSVIQLITEPVYCVALSSAFTLEGESIETHIEIKMTSFVLSTLGATCTYEIISPDTPPQALEFIGTKVVMQDGREIVLRPKSGAWNNDANHGEFTFTLDAPIILTEVDFVQLPDGSILPIT